MLKTTLTAAFVMLTLALCSGVDSELGGLGRTVAFVGACSLLERIVQRVSAHQG